MRRFTIVIIGMWSLSLFGQGMQFFEGSLEEAQELARQEQKLIFVDAYTKWCGPCKRMAKFVFTDESVGNYFNDHFINLKIDMEESMGRQFRRTYPVSAYPTLLFIDENGELVRREVGGRAADAFIALGKEVISKYDRSGQYEEKYNNGDRTYQLVLEYIKALNQAGKSSQKIANEFLRQSGALTDDQLANFLYEALTSSDSRIFDLYTNNLSNIRKLKGDKAANEKIIDACWTTVYNAITFEIRDLLIEAQQKAKKYVGADAESFEWQSNYQYAQATNDLTLLNTSAKELSSGALADDASELTMLAEELMLYFELYPDVKKTAESIAARAVKIVDSDENVLLYSKILIANDKGKKAKKYVEKALKQIEPGDVCYDEFEKLSQQLQGR